MSTGNCSDIDTYIFILRQVLDGESSLEDEAYLSNHLEACSCCLGAYNLEKNVRKMLKTKLVQRSVPEGLANSIRAKILQAGLNVR
jgi:anti-sigma factor (TIGR02949 family)